VVDAREGLTALDRAVGASLRKVDVPVICVANKAEGNAGIQGISEAFGLGFGDPVPISAEHGEGMDFLYEALQPFEVGRAEEEEENEGEERAIRIAVVGRPNAGKSTLINRLIGEERLITGPEPGLTRDSIGVEWRFEGRRIKLFDTAGLRKKARV